jgi:PilZ domain
MRHEQRKYLRYPVEGQAMLFAEQLESAISCHMIDLGLEGCRLRHAGDIPVQAGMTVEIAFRLNGTLFRFPGTIQWSAKNSILGLYFTKISDSHRNELVDLLGAMHEEMEARAKEARDKLNPQETTQAEQAEPQETAQAGTLHLVPNPAQNQAPSLTPTAKSGPPRRRERREHDRHEIDSFARVLFLSIHTRVTGKVLDLSLGGCRIRAQQEIPVGAYRRVEVEFMVDGLPLLLPGVTTSLHDKFTTGIRFVEMTDRKRAQLQTVIDEISEKFEKLQKGRKNAPTENNAEVPLDATPEATPAQA